MPPSRSMNAYDRLLERHSASCAGDNAHLGSRSQMGARLTTAPRVSPRAFERGSVSLAVSTKDKALTFSLAMPSRNMAPYIGSAVRSLLDQPGVNVELLIQDACSNDTTSEVLDAHNDSRVKVFREEDSGPADAINRGLSKAKGDIFGWLNADDELEPGALSKVIRVFEDEPAVELVYGRGFYVDEEGIRLKPYDVRPFDPKALTDPRLHTPARRVLATKPLGARRPSRSNPGLGIRLGVVHPSEQ